MRGVLLLLAIAIVVTLLTVVVLRTAAVAPGQRRQLPRGGRWQVDHYAEDDATVVVVARLTPSGELLDQHIVARIPDADDDWSRKFLQAKQEAEERAFHLNADTDGG